MLSAVKKISAILLITLVNVAYADITKTLLVLDMQNQTQLPRNFRSSSDSIKIPNSINAVGLSELNMMGSAQFSETSLKRILQPLKHKKVMIIDLRQESHGMLDGNAISWYAPKNAVNAGKSPQQIERDESRLLSAINEKNEVQVFKILNKNDDEVIVDARPSSYMVRTVGSEAAIADEMHVNYERIYVEDFHAPTDKEVDRFLKLLPNIQKNQWLYFHCRAGVGRTTTFMAMYDMIRNAKRVSFDDILARQSAIGGKDLTEMPPKDNFKYPLAVARLDFLKKFYDYAQTNDDNFKTLWSEWVARG